MHSNKVFKKYISFAYNLHLVTCTSGCLNLELLACRAWQNLGLWRRFRLDSSTCIHLKAFLKPNRPVNLRVISYINTYKYEAKQQGTVFKSSIKVRNSCAWVPQGCEGQTGVWSTCGKFIKRPWHLWEQKHWKALEKAWNRQTYRRCSFRSCTRNPLKSASWLILMACLPDSWSCSLFCWNPGDWTPCKAELLDIVT